MSFILDALKKSEIERQRQSVPGLMDARSAPRRHRLPLWAMVLCALLGVNLVVLTYVLTRNRSAPVAVDAPRTDVPRTDVPRTDVPRSDVARTDSPRSDAPPAASFSPLDTAPVYAPEIPVSTAPAATPTPQVAPRSTLSGFGTATARAAARRPDPVLDADARSDEEVLPTINEINLTGAQALPDIHLDVHVYGTKPADRFVFINMRKYHEGSTLQEGPTIERIRRDGVILNYMGLRFLLPRQS